MTKTELKINFPELYAFGIHENIILLLLKGSHTCTIEHLNNRIKDTGGDVGHALYVLDWVYTPAMLRKYDVQDSNDLWCMLLSKWNDFKNVKSDGM